MSNIVLRDASASKNCWIGTEVQTRKQISSQRRCVSKKVIHSERKFCFNPTHLARIRARHFPTNVLGIIQTISMKKFTSSYAGSTSDAQSSSCSLFKIDGEAAFFSFCGFPTSREPSPKILVRIGVEK